jgi:PIN like domain
VPDVEWLEMCGMQVLPVLSKDRRLRYRPQEIAAIRRHRVKAFVLTQGSLRAAEQVKRFERNREAIEAVCRDPGPFVYAVYSDRIVRIYP